MTNVTTILRNLADPPTEKDVRQVQNWLNTVGKSKAARDLDFQKWAAKWKDHLGWTPGMPIAVQEWLRAESAGIHNDSCPTCGRCMNLGPQGFTDAVRKDMRERVQRWLELEHE